jgi:hypothetical protein
MSVPKRDDLTMDAFARSWSAEVLKGPPLIAPARQFLYPVRVPGEEDALNRGALHVMVRPGRGGAFLATFALGFTDPGLPSGVWSSPEPAAMLVVAGGYAYLVDTEDPESGKLMEQRPATAILAAPDAQLLLLAGFYDVLAVGAEGVRWRTGRLSWEGVILTEVREGLAQGLGWDMYTDLEVPFKIDLQTGAHEGGGYRR